jgi:hypothetical protein
MDRIALHSFLVRHRFAVVSSISGDGTPQSALVGIAITPQLEIIFDTVRSTNALASFTRGLPATLTLGLLHSCL